MRTTGARPRILDPSSRFSAPLADRLNLFWRNVQKLEEFLVLTGRRFFELRVPTVHIVFGEPGRTHDFNPLLFGNHWESP